MENGDFGTIGGMEIGRGEKPTLVPNWKVCRHSVI
jgi:hypothetical protein